MNARLVRSLTLLLASSLISFAPSPAHAAWPSDGVSLFSTYHPFSDMRIDVDELGAVRVLALATGTSPATQGYRIAADGTFLTALDFYGTASTVPFTTDGAGGFLHSATVLSPSTAHACLERESSSNVHAPTNTGVSPYSLWRASTSTGAEFSTVCASDDSGGAYVAWTTNTLANVLTRMNSSGSLDGGWPANGKLVSGAGASPTVGERVFRDGHGGALCVWLANASPTAPCVTRLGRLGAFAPGWTSSGLVLAPAGTATDFSQRVSLVASGSNAFIAGWWNADGSSADGIRLQRFGLDGTLDAAWPANGFVVVASGTSVAHASIADDGDGGAYVLWEQAGAPHLQHVTSAGALASGFSDGGISPLDADAVYAASSTDLVGVRSSRDGVIVLWNDTRSSQPGIRARWLLSDGSPDPAEPAARLVAASAPADEFPMVARVRAACADGADGLFVAWTSERPLPAGCEARASRLFSSAVLAAPPPTPASHAALSIGPNPARGSFVARLARPLGSGAAIELIDPAGRCVRREWLEAGATEHRFERVEALAPGVYVVRIAGEHGPNARVAVVR